MAANPMASRSAALAGAAQALNKPKPLGGRQDLSGAKDGTIRGAHGGTQQLGEAAKRRLGGQQDPNQSPPIIAPNTAGGGLNPAAKPGMDVMPIAYDQKPGPAGFTKPLALPGFMSAGPKPDPGMQIFGDGAKLPPEAANMMGGAGELPPMPPEVAQMISERMGSGEMMGGAPGMSGGDSPDIPFGGRGGKLPGFGTIDGGPGGGPLGGKPMQTKPIFNPNGGMQAEGPMGAIPGARPKPGMPTKPLETDPPAPAPGGVWGQIAGGGGLRPRNNMASY